MNLNDDYSVTGELHLPASDGLVRFSLNGGFAMENGRIRLYHDADLALRDVAFRFDPDESSLSGTIVRQWANSVAITFKR